MLSSRWLALYWNNHIFIGEIEPTHLLFSYKQINKHDLSPDKPLLIIANISKHVTINTYVYINHMLLTRLGMMIIAICESGFYLLSCLFMSS